MKPEIFVKETQVQTDAKNAFVWHERAGALQRLTPPWQKMKIIHQGAGIKKGVKVKMINSFFGLPVKMEAEHTDYIEGEFFRDELQRGPFSLWAHNHSFFDEGENSSILQDKILYRLPWYYPGFVKRLVKNELIRIFNYRHKIFANDIKRHSNSKKSMTFLISGSSGLLGSTLIPFLTTGGNTVYTLVRRKPEPDKNEVYWNPEEGILDLDKIGKIDVVINLNGSPVAEGRWTKKRKEKIVKSRTIPTELLAKKISELDDKPELFFTASAIGYYGECGSELISEKIKAGDLFISEVCKKWEEATQQVAGNGIRVVNGRIGIVLTPKGGALNKMLPGFSAGLGGRLSNGEQYMSWISLDDTIGAIWKIVMDNTIKGPVNIAAPNPVTNAEFSSTLGRVLSRPVFLLMPAWLVKLIWGNMGRELLLSGVRAKPEKLLEAGYEFCHENLEEAFLFELGK